MVRDFVLGITFSHKIHVKLRRPFGTAFGLHFTQILFENVTQEKITWTHFFEISKWICEKKKLAGIIISENQDQNFIYGPKRPNDEIIIGKMTHLLHYVPNVPILVAIRPLCTQTISVFPKNNFSIQFLIKILYSSDSGTVTFCEFLSNFRKNTKSGNSPGLLRFFDIFCNSPRVTAVLQFRVYQLQV